MSENEQPKQKLVEVILVKPHKHAGQRYEAGAKIMVSEPDRDWLAEQKIIQTAAEAKSK